jgi:hypothetical protein
MSGESSGLVARFDKQTPSAPLETFDVTSIDPDATYFMQATWDGRYVYLMTGRGKWPHPKSLVVRYDTRLDFRSKASWTAFDMTPLVPDNLASVGWSGGVVFDGEYLYIPGRAGDPMNSTPFMMRFDARSPRKMPSGFSGTFFYVW